ncbi:trypsin-like serine protease [Aurantimonas sp. A2-1-M11]|uniref:trypsin-like serine protease n=1 Tax=Aurantimonas sp. A2-1-M11 TaxID=3113712 RepID=UPI002F934D59
MSAIITLLSSSLAWGQLDVAQPVLSPYFMMKSLRQNVVIDGQPATARSQTRRFAAHLVFAHSDDLEKPYGSYDLKACTGVLIHPNVIATAAHCLEHEKVTIRTSEIYRYNSVRISFGYSENDPDYFQTISNDMIMHPEYFSYNEETKVAIHQGPDDVKTVDTPVAKDGDGKIRVTLEPKWGYYKKVKDGRANSTQFFRRPHENMNIMHRSGANDIALIFLKESVREPFRPVKIFDDHRSLSHKQSLWVAGFGVDHFETRHQTLNNPRLRLAEYVMEGIYTETVHTKRVLKGLFSFPKNNHYACNGDSGGPALVYVGDNVELLSISSSSEANCVGFHFGPTVAPFTRWIEAWMASRGLSFPDGA